jgi:hypothetical protein
MRTGQQNDAAAHKAARPVRNHLRVISENLASEFLVVGGNGDVYSANEGHGWLEQSRWRYVEHKPLGGPATLLVAGASA